MQTLTAIILFGLVASCYCRRGNTGSGDAAGRAHLRKELFYDYDKLNIPDDVQVKLGLALMNLDTDENRGVFHTGSWLKFNWVDSRLRWDNSTNRINAIRVGAHEVWKPDIVLYNSADVNKDTLMNCWQSNVVLYHTGEIIWIPSCQLQSYCNFTLDRQPYGEQECSLKFGSWTYDAMILDIDFYMDKAVDLSDFKNKEWKITGNKAVRNEKLYPCCPEPYADITYTLKFQRREELHACKA